MRRRAAPAEPIPMPIFAPVSSPLLLSLLELGVDVDVDVDVSEDALLVDEEPVVVLAPGVPAALVIVAGLKFLVQDIVPPAAVGTVFGHSQFSIPGSVAPGGGGDGARRGGSSRGDKEVVNRYIRYSQHKARWSLPQPTVLSKNRTGHTWSWLIWSTPCRRRGCSGILPSLYRRTRRFRNAEWRPIPGHQSLPSLGTSCPRKSHRYILLCTCLKLSSDR